MVCMSKRRKKPRTRPHCKSQEDDDLASQLRTAAAADLVHLLRRSSEPPPTLSEVLASDGWNSAAIRALVHRVGSVAEVESLTIEPHIDPSFDWSGIAGPNRDTIDELLILIHASNINRYLDAEYETIMWRVIRMLALDPARPLDRKTKPARKAAAVAWVALKTNGQISRRRGVSAQDIWDAFGVASCSALAKEYAQVILVSRLGKEDAEYCQETWWDNTTIPVASAQLLASRRRLQLIRQREQIVESIAERHADVGPISSSAKGSVSFKARPTSVRWASRGSTDEGDDMVTIALGDLDELELVAISVPDARRLRAALDGALGTSPLAGLG